MLLLPPLLLAVFSPLLGALLAGIGGKRLGRVRAHFVTITLMGVSFFAALCVAVPVLQQGLSFDETLYTWALSGHFEFDVGFFVDPLVAVMLLVVTGVSWLVHIYSVGYMADDPSHERFFCYMSAFTFAMLMLVTADNFFQLFFGWEGVGLVSYLLIGFWFQKASAASGSLKAFIVNRVGDAGFILGIAALLDATGSLDYQTVFAHATQLAQTTISIWPGSSCSELTFACILLFIGAMGKSAQIPLHVWLPESMEGPTPISALIHAATMVTAGVFMVARLSPLFSLSPVALSVVLVVGSTGALFLGLLAFVENDIKRVIAYSTMSQLGYMMAADGAGAYAAGIFHLMTHAGFKALLFLSAGSVIVALHHEQDLRRMGNLKKYLPVTCVCFLVGALALSAIPPFAGFYSKDLIIDAVAESPLPGASYAYLCLLLGAFVTAYYIFRAYFMAFHTKERFGEETKAHLHETAWSMRLPLVVLSIVSMGAGMWAMGPLVMNPQTVWSFSQSAWADPIAVMRTTYAGVWVWTRDSMHHLPCLLSVLGIVCAWLSVCVIPRVRDYFVHGLPWMHRALQKQYGFEVLNQVVFVRGVQKASDFFYHVTDLKWIDHTVVNGIGRGFVRLSGWVRRWQTGYLYHYALVMIVGLLVLLVVFV